MHKNQSNGQFFSFQDERDVLLARCKATIDDLKTELERTSEDNSQLESRYQHLLNNFQKQEKELEDQRAFSEEMIDELNAFKKEMETQRGETQELKVLFGDKNQQLEESQLQIKILTEKIEMQDHIIQESNTQLTNRESSALNKGDNSSKSQQNQYLKLLLDKKMQLLKEGEEQVKGKNKQIEDMQNHMKLLNEHIQRQADILKHISQLEEEKIDASSEKQSNKFKSEPTRTKSSQLIIEQAELIRRLAEQIRVLESKSEREGILGIDTNKIESREQLNSTVKNRIKASSSTQQEKTISELQTMYINNQDEELTQVKQESLSVYYSMQEIIQQNEEALSQMHLQNKQLIMQVANMRLERDVLEETRKSLTKKLAETESQVYKLNHQVKMFQQEQISTKRILERREIKNPNREEEKSQQQQQQQQQFGKEKEDPNFFKNKKDKMASSEENENISPSTKYFIQHDENKNSKMESLINIVSKQTQELAKSKQQFKKFFDNHHTLVTEPQNQRQYFQNNQNINENSHYKNEEEEENEIESQKKRRSQSYFKESAKNEKLNQVHLATQEGNAKYQDHISDQRNTTKKKEQQLSKSSSEMKQKIIILEQALQLKQTENILLKEGISSQQNLCPSNNRKKIIKTITSITYS